VDYNWMNATPFHEDDVLGERSFQIIVDHGISAVLDHHDLARVGLQPRQGLGENRCLLD
jgi:hypothetical protein